MLLFYLSAAFLLGVSLAPTCPWTALVWLLLAATGAILGAAVHFFSQKALSSGRQLPGSRFEPLLRPLLEAARLSPRAFAPALLLALPFLAAGALALGAARATVAQPDPTAAGHIRAYNDDGRTYTITGLLAAPADERDSYTNLRVAAESIRPRDDILHQEVSGTLLARIETGGEWRYGDRLVVTGRLETPPEDQDFSYRDYLARQGVYSLVPFGEAAVLERGRGNRLLSWMFALRRWSFDTIHHLYPDPAASLLAGILLGLDSGLPADLQEAFRDTGTSHIIAISGFNITILSAVVLSSLGRVFGRRAGAWLAAGTIGTYAILVGADPAVLRAAIMGLAAILLRDVRRPGAVYNILALTAALMAFANPAVIGDVGYQLSFAATVGLIRFSKTLTRSFSRTASRYLPISVVRRLTPPVADAVLLTLAAQVTTLPIIIYHFERISLSSLAVNPLILPAQPALMILGGLSLLAGLLWLPLGKLLALPVQPLVTYTIRLVEVFGALPGGAWALGSISLPVTAALYLGIFGIPLVGKLAQRLNLGRLTVKAAVLFGLVVLASLAWRRALAIPDGRLHLTVLEAGAGDGILIRGPNGRYLLVDGGPALSQLSDQLGRWLPPGDRRLDWLVVARPGDEQLGALPRLLERFSPHAVLWSGPPNASRSARLLQEALSERGTPLTEAETGQKLDLGAGAVLEVISMGKGGAVLLVRWKNFRALLPVGQDRESLNRPVEPVSVLLLAEQGYAALNPADWIWGLRPQATVLSVEAGNRQGLPSAETLEALSGYSLLRTDRNGWVHFQTDGVRLWTEASRAE